MIFSSRSAPSYGNDTVGASQRTSESNDQQSSFISACWLMSVGGVSSFYFPNESPRIGAKADIQVQHSAQPPHREPEIDGGARHPGRAAPSPFYEKLIGWSFALVFAATIGLAAFRHSIPTPF